MVLVMAFSLAATWPSATIFVLLHYVFQNACHCARTSDFFDNNLLLKNKNRKISDQAPFRKKSLINIIVNNQKLILQLCINNESMPNAVAPVCQAVGIALGNHRTSHAKCTRRSSAGRSSW